MRAKIIRIISLVLIVITIISVSTIPAFALSWDGSSTGGGGNTTSAGANGYAIRTDADNCIGYRFSVVDKNGGTKNGAVIDVFRNTSYGNMEYGSAYKFNTKYNKKQLINNQNYGFSTSKNTNNCFKEVNMGFTTGLPAPGGMGTWQNYTGNLNAVLGKLNLGNINNLKNGDKILVEPLYDLRLESVYHAVTVTETAIYGKHILGASSNGGSSYTPASWGFISSYTNRYYPNELYTPDGQGLWNGVGALGSRATFYTLINSGYGVGIAYTETKPDFTPTLWVRKCEAWPGNVSTRNSNHYGISYGSAFGNYEYGHGYPVLGDKVWFAVNFPSESENCYVRQTVWVDGGGSTTRNVYSHSGTWYDVALSPTTVDAGRSGYYVKARVDWIDGNGNTLKWGAEKTFYIPVKPKIDRYQVSMYDIVGNTSAYNGSGGSSGSVYVGQRTRVKYTYTSQNTWTSYNYLRGRMYKWSNNAWNSVKAWNAYTGDADLYVDNAGINKSYAYSKYSDIGQFRVPDNSANTNGGNRIPFYMWTHWSSDIDHTTETTWIDIPVIKADVELLDIALIDANGNYITGRNVYAYNTVTPQYVYKNNTDCTVYVEGYNNDGTKISGIYAIPANGTIRVNGKPVTVDPDKTTFSIWGGVYLEGAGKSNTDWEKEDFESQNNNHWLRYWNVVHPLTIEAVTPNSGYRVNTQVITSFKIKNAGTFDFIPDNNISVSYEVLRDSDAARMVVSASARDVVPKNNENLVFLKWKTANAAGRSYTVRATLKDRGKVIYTATLTRTLQPEPSSQTPDTQYEGGKPSRWSASSSPTPYKNSATWSQWVYTDGAFQKKTYGIGFGNDVITIWPASGAVTATQTDGIWNMKSGYGISLSAYSYLSSVSGALMPSSSAYTATQRAYARLPEYNYSTAGGKYRTLDLNGWQFCFAQNSNANNDRTHFIPLWYPNGTQNYTVSCYFYDLWTPAGMISSRSNSNSVSVNGSLYDDHYIGRGN
ncbi:MAG: hypothetical protein PHV32_00085 [Eubacteriales bacterium]|nr:hypothetical protein [Eubacteriales bacterium]